MKKALITGITGQDGAYLSELLLNKGYEVIGTSRKIVSNYNWRLKHLKINKDVKILKIDSSDENKIKNIIKNESLDEIYNLSGISSVSDSFKNPIKTFKANTISCLQILNYIYEVNKKIKFYQASSSEMFGASNKTLNENSPFNPNSPYAEAKLINHLKVKELNENYNWPIFSGIMFNHESEFRNKDYLIMKIIRSAQEISINPNKRLTLGSLDYIRDWSYASDTVNAIYEITSKASTSDYVIGSGVGKSIKEMVNHIFNYFNLDWTNFVDINQNLLREGDPVNIVSDPSKLKRELNWNAEFNFNQMLDKCIKGFNKLDSV